MRWNASKYRVHLSQDQLRHLPKSVVDRQGRVTLLVARLCSLLAAVQLSKCPLRMEVGVLTVASSLGATYILQCQEIVAKVFQ
jgi:hypothetical protein